MGSKRFRLSAIEQLMFFREKLSEAAAKMAALEDLLRGLMSRWQIAPVGVLAHSDIAPDRKIDPGLHFDWQRLMHK